MDKTNANYLIPVIFPVAAEGKFAFYRSASAIGRGLLARHPLHERLVQDRLVRIAA